MFYPPEPSSGFGMVNRIDHVHSVKFFAHKLVLHISDAHYSSIRYYTLTIHSLTYTVFVVVRNEIKIYRYRGVYIHLEKRFIDPCLHYFIY